MQSFVLFFCCAVHTEIQQYPPSPTWTRNREKKIGVRRLPRPRKTTTGHSIVPEASPEIRSGQGRFDATAIDY